MRFDIRYSRGVRAAYLQIAGNHRVVARTMHPVGDDQDVLIDFDANGQVIGIELLGVDEPVVHILDDDAPDAASAVKLIQQLRVLDDLL
jgi:uncharacterized protein YuzE